MPGYLIAAHKKIPANARLIYVLYISEATMLNQLLAVKIIESSLI